MYLGMILSGESVPGVVEFVGWKGVKKLFIDRLKEREVVVLDADRIGIWWDC